MSLDSRRLEKICCWVVVMAGFRVDGLKTMYVCLFL